MKKKKENRTQLNGLAERPSPGGGKIQRTGGGKKLLIDEPGFCFEKNGQVKKKGKNRLRG